MLLTGALIGAVWVGLLAVTHLVLTAWRPGLNRSRVASRLLLLALAGAAGTALLTAQVAADTSVTAAASAAVHPILAAIGALVTVLCGFVLYMPLYYAVVSSLSGQLLIRLDEAPDGRLSRATLAGPETLQQILQPRLGSMVRSGLLHEDGGRWCATARGRRTAALFRAVKALWRLGPGG
ncbi:MAG: hypothetical protein IT306_15070 [Chloroflexi bacterium]|nr:hypothetical protein [Chloroflexota bacterium]